MKKFSPLALIKKYRLFILAAAVLSGLGAIMDSQIAILGANMTAFKAGVDITPSYKDIL